jgi:hypothetical protein
MNVTFITGCEISATQFLISIPHSLPPVGEPVDFISLPDTIASCVASGQTIFGLFLSNRPPDPTYGACFAASNTNPNDWQISSAKA